MADAPGPAVAAPEAPKPPAPPAVAAKPELKGLKALTYKAKEFAAGHKGLVYGGGAVLGAGLVAALVAGAIPLWKKVIQPRLEELKKKGKGGKVKRSVEEEYVDELIADEEFMSFLGELAEHMGLE